MHKTIKLKKEKKEMFEGLFSFFFLSFLPSKKLIFDYCEKDFLLDEAFCVERDGKVFEFKRSFLNEFSATLEI